MVDSGQEFEQIDYTEHPITEVELRKFWKLSGLPIKKFFNTSGNLYREFELKDKLNDMGDDEKFEILTNNPMLIKRPILVLEDKVLVGFNEGQWRDL